MRQPFVLVLTALILLSAFAAGAAEGRAPVRPNATSETPGHHLLPTSAASAAPLSRITMADTTILGEWTFDDGMGGPDPQGWTTVDRTVQIGTFFHVDDFAGLNWNPPFEGARSLWCGARPCAMPDVCSYASLPGYGNGWDQRFESVAFPATGDVNMAYLIRWDTEPSYDFVYVQYQSRSGRWNTLRTYSGSGAWSHSVTAPADSLAGSVRFRFLFQSDDAFSDEDGLFDTDGAVIIDMIEVASGGTIDYQDFESEAVGATATVDGHWTATMAPVYGNFAGLFDGSTVLQEDSLVTNNTHFWAFFNGSPVSYACGGHPEQMAVPFSMTSEGEPVYLSNAIRSPAIPLAGVTLGSVILSFDVYRDLPLDNLVFYDWDIRSRVGGMWRSWKNRDYVYYGSQKDWFATAFEVADLIDPNATDIQIRISARDLCLYWCGVNGSGNCHSQAPLVDNVRLVSFSDEYFVTNVNASGPGSLRQAIVDANATPGASRIGFDIPGAGPHTIFTPTFPTITSPLIIDGRSQPGYAGSPLIWLRGIIHAPGTVNCFIVEATRCEFYGLKLEDFGHSTTPQGNGITINSDNCVVRACVLEFCGTGVAIDGDGNTIGGVLAGEPNTIQTCAERAVYVVAGTGNTIRGNSMNGSLQFGIDLAPMGVTPNDSQDADTGPNDLLNFPELEYVVYGAPGAVAGYLFGTPHEVMTIDFYASPVCDQSGNGEGAVYLGSTTSTILPEDMASRFYALLDNVPAGQVVTATATDSRGNTSEFSACNSVAGSAFVVTNTLSTGAGSLAAAISAANASSDLSIIRFDIPGAGPHRIYTGGFPALSNNTIIDGFTQAGASPNTNPLGQPDNAVIKIEICGSSPNATNGIAVGGNVYQSQIAGLSIIGFRTGIRLLSNSNSQLVQGCRIGVDASGSVAIGNDVGVLMNRGVIGGVMPAFRNIISGNTGDAVQMPGNYSWLFGNLIGVAADGVTALGNGGNGISVLSTSNVGNRIGDTSAGSGNIIAHNGGGIVIADGIKVQFNRIVGNSIYSNGGLGIDLNGDGVTQNDPLDIDPGPNLLQNFPVINSAVSTAGGMSVTGTLATSANRTFKVDFYASPERDPSGYGEGKVYLGGTSVATNANGDATFGVSLAAMPGGWFVTATARDAVENTSEFSACVEVINTPTGSGITTSPVDSTTGTTPVTVTFGNVTVAGNTTLATGPTGPALPGSFLAGNSIYYDLSTTATFTGSAEVCITYDEANLAVPEGALRMLHYDAGVPGWVDVTSSLDTGGNVVCGTVTSLSPFVLGAGSATGVGPKPGIPSQFALRQNIPNPFNPTTMIGYDVPVGGADVSITIYDVSGRRVRVLVDEHRAPGRHQAPWDGRNARGEQVASGVYFYRMVAGSFVEARKMVLLK